MSKVNKILGYIFVIFMAIITLFPFFYMISSSLMTFQEVTSIPPKLLPETAQASNFSEAMKVAPFARYFFNTIFVTIVNTLGTPVSYTHLRAHET